MHNQLLAWIWDPITGPCGRNSTVLHLWFLPNTCTRSAVRTRNRAHGCNKGLFKEKVTARTSELCFASGRPNAMSDKIENVLNAAAAGSSMKEEKHFNHNSKEQADKRTHIIFQKLIAAKSTIGSGQNQQAHTHGYPAGPQAGEPASNWINGGTIQKSSLHLE